MKNNFAEPFLVVPIWLFRAKINGRSLTRAEMDVLSLIYQFTDRGKRVLNSSDRYIARRLNHSSNTVRRAVCGLREAGLINVQKGKDGNFSGYAVNAALYNAMRNEAKADKQNTEETLCEKKKT